MLEVLSFCPRERAEPPSIKLTVLTFLWKKNNKQINKNKKTKTMIEAFRGLTQGFPFGGVCSRAVNTSKSGSGPEVRDSSLARCVVSLERELYSTLSLFTEVHKWLPATYCWGGGGGLVTLRWTSIPSRGE